MGKPKWQMEIELPNSVEIRKKINTYQSKIKALRVACQHPKGFEKSDLENGELVNRCEFCGSKE